MSRMPPGRTHASARLLLVGARSRGYTCKGGWETASRPAPACLAAKRRPLWAEEKVCVSLTTRDYRVRMEGGGVPLAWRKSATSFLPFVWGLAFPEGSHGRPVVSFSQQNCKAGRAGVSEEERWGPSLIAVPALSSTSRVTLGHSLNSSEPHFPEL